MGQNLAITRVMAASALASAAIAEASPEKPFADLSRLSPHRVSTIECHSPVREREGLSRSPSLLSNLEHESPKITDATLAALRQFIQETGSSPTAVKSDLASKLQTKNKDQVVSPLDSLPKELQDPAKRGQIEIIYRHREQFAPRPTVLAHRHIVDREKALCVAAEYQHGRGVGIEKNPIAILHRTARFPTPPNP